jgi:hypothetical protein
METYHLEGGTVMGIKLTVDSKYIVVLKLFAAHNSMNNHHLESINLEIGRKATYFFATDGVMLGCFYVESDQLEVDKPLHVSIPVKMFRDVRPIRRTVEIVIDSLGLEGGHSVEVVYNGVSKFGISPGDSIVKWRNFFPSELSGESAMLDLQRLGVLGRAWGILHSKDILCTARIGFNGQSASLIDLGHPNFTGILMPIRPPKANEPPVKTPPWVSYPPPRFLLLLTMLARGE